MSLSTVTPPTLYPPRNAASTLLASAHTSGATTLAVTTGGGALFGTPSTGSPLRVTAVRASDGHRVHYLCTGVTGDVLTVAVMDGYGDAALVAGDAVGCWASAETFADLAASTAANAAAINNHAAGAAALATANAFTAQQYFAQATLAYGSTVAWNLAAAQAAKLTLTGNATITPSGAVAGASYTLVVVQDATGSRTLTFSGVKWPGGTAPTLSTAANAVDVFSFVGDGTNLYGVGQKGFA